MENKPRHYPSWDDAIAAVDDRFSCKVKDGLSLEKGTLAVDVSKIVIPEDKVKGVYALPRRKRDPKPPKPVVVAAPVGRTHKEKPPCDHVWVKHGKEHRERGRRRRRCKLCHTSETIAPGKKR